MFGVPKVSRVPWRGVDAGKSMTEPARRRVVKTTPSSSRRHFKGDSAKCSDWMDALGRSGTDFRWLSELVKLVE